MLLVLPDPYTPVCEYCSYIDAINTTAERQKKLSASYSFKVNELEPFSFTSPRPTSPLRQCECILCTDANRARDRELKGQWPADQAPEVSGNPT